MYTILIVDDEKLALEGVLYSVGVSGFPFHWIMEAENAEAALKIIAVNKPDILLTDIKMGEKSGLDLIREAKEIHPNIVAGIICGYPDFAFAQEALTLGVCGYLLKPVKKREVKELLTKATQIIRKQRESRNLSKDNYLFQRTLEEHNLQESANMYISSGGREGGDVLSSFFDESCKWFQILVLRTPMKNTASVRPCRGRDIVIYGIQNIATELIHEAAYIKGMVTGSIEHENIILIFLASQCKEHSIAAEDFYQQMVKIKKNVDRAYDIHIAAASSSIQPSLNANMYLEAISALDLRLSVPDIARSQVLRYDKYKKYPVKPSESDHFLILKKLLNQHELGQSVELIREVIERFRDTPEIGIRRIYTGIVNVISVAGYKDGISLLPLLGSESISGSILNTFEVLDEIAENLINTLLNNYEGRQKNEDADNIMLRIRNYIDNSFVDNELSTNKLSKKFSISLGYLSACYKKEHGITISKYINNKRMEYAENLLRETSLSVGQIAEASGFNNLSYFLRLFKNIHSLTPSQYRNLNESA